MKYFTIGLIKRLLVSIGIVCFIIAFGSLYGHFVGPSKIAYAGAVMLIAWPWALPQVFVAVCIIWFIIQRLNPSKHRIP
jgi:hypothetical protein